MKKIKLNVSLPAWQCASSIVHFLCVSNQMFFQAVWSAERLNTQGATKGFLSSMHSHVLPQPVYSVECFGALGTPVGLFLGWINFLVPRIKQNLHATSGVTDTHHVDADPKGSFHSDMDSTFNFMRILVRILPFTGTFSQIWTLQCSKINLLGFHLITLKRIRILLFTLMRIRILPSILMRIRTQLNKMMRIRIRNSH